MFKKEEYDPVKEGKQQSSRDNLLDHENKDDEKPHDAPKGGYMATAVAQKIADDNGFNKMT